MPRMPPVFRPRSHGDRQVVQREQDRARGSAAERGYDSRWRKASRSHLTRSPVCRYCEADAWGNGAAVTAATLVDHLFPHRGDTGLFWSTEWWVSSCKACHDGPKQAVERAGWRGLDRLADLLGLPPRS
jgi:5-methylcytosine-specific restriction protein A